MNPSLVAIAVAVVIEERQEAFELKETFAKREVQKKSFCSKVVGKLKSFFS